MSTPYVFATVGTTGFDDLIEATDGMVAELGATGLAQIGPGRYQPRHLPYERFVSTIVPQLERADVVVSHGGAATTLEVLKARVPLVSVANPDRYDQHQNDLLAALSARGHLVWCRSIAELGASVEQALSSGLPPLDPVESTIGELIEDHLRRPRRRFRRQRSAAR